MAIKIGSLPSTMRTRSPGWLTHSMKLGQADYLLTETAAYSVLRGTTPKIRARVEGMAVAHFAGVQEFLVAGPKDGSSCKVSHLKLKFVSL